MEEKEFVEIEEVEVESKGVLAKVKSGAKKHWKGIAVGAAALVGGFIGYAIGAKPKNETVIENDFDFDDTNYSDEPSDDEE